MRIPFSVPSTFLGRNGVFKATGLSVTTGGIKKIDRLYLEPVTSKGEIGRAHIEIPAQDLNDVIVALQIIQGKIERWEPCV